MAPKETKEIRCNVHTVLGALVMYFEMRYTKYIKLLFT